MTAARAAPRVFSIGTGAPFLRTLAQALADGRLVPGFAAGPDPLALASATVYVPTRRAARALRSIFVEMQGGGSAVLPSVRALGEFAEDEAIFASAEAAAIDLDPPIPAMERLLLLAPLVRRWKQNLPGHVAQLFAEEFIVPASAADSLWLARDLAALMDEVETEDGDWTRLAELVPGELAGWWQVTVKFLEIVTDAWPQLLAERGQSNPAAHRSALIRLEAERLRRHPPPGPVIAAGSTGSIPATAGLLSVIARLQNGAVVLPGLDLDLDAASWAELVRADPATPVLGHPQFGLAKLLGKIGVERRDVQALGSVPHPLAVRARLVGEALRPAETTDAWSSARAAFGDAELDKALEAVTLVEASNERDEAAAIAVALKMAVAQDGRRAALVTGDRELARRVSSELLRFGVLADDSGGMPLARTPPGQLLRLMLAAIFRPGDPVAVLSLLKHPLLLLGRNRAEVQEAARTVELVALRGGTGRPDIAVLAQEFEARLETLADGRRPPFWLARLGPARIAAARRLASAMATALAPLASLRETGSIGLAETARATVVALEALGRDAGGSVSGLYQGEAGEALATFLRGLVAAETPFDFAPGEWPDVMEALIGPEVVKPSVFADERIAIWGALEARLQSVDTLVVGGLNEGVWPRRPQADRFMSRIMKRGLSLEPPERRIGLAAHDFQMATGSARLVLTRSARAGDAPAVPSRWLQRLLAFVGSDKAAAVRERGETLLHWARSLDAAANTGFAARPNPKPAVALRPKHFSVTEIETLRRDPYAVYARRVLKLSPLEALLRDPGAAERGTLFHEILHRFSASGTDARSEAAVGRLLEIGRACFDEAALPADIEAVWWPRFQRMTAEIITWEAGRAALIAGLHPEARARATEVEKTGVTLSGYADRIDRLPGGMADILDYKTSSSPSRTQAHTLLAPQLALEGALLMRGAFETGKLEPADLVYVRLRANGRVEPESILEIRDSIKSAKELSEDAWQRLAKLLQHYAGPGTGYLSRALPFREDDMDGDYDHLARVLEWSAGADSPEDAGA